MALDFGKLNFSVSFNPTSAFPLDARSYFESLTSAQAAAASAQEAGDSTTTYYYGQTIAVVESGTATLYVIQPNKTLAAVGGEISINENVFTFDESGNLDLYAFADAVSGAQLTKGSDGKISWVKPDTTTVEGLSTAVAALEQTVGDSSSGLVKDVADNSTAIESLTSVVGNAEAGLVKDVADNTAAISTIETTLADKANIDDVYTKSQVDGLVSSTFTYKGTVQNYAALPTTDNKIGDVYNIEESTLASGIRAGDNVAWNGTSWDVLAGFIDLSEYATTEDLAEKVDKVEGKQLSTEDFTTALKTKLEGVAEGATAVIVENVLTSTSTTNALSAAQGKALKDQIDAIDLSDYALKTELPGIAGENLGLVKNGGNVVIGEDGTLNFTESEDYISSVDTTQFTVSAGQLTLNNLAISKVTGLTEALADKVDVEEGKGLSTNDFTNEYKAQLDSFISEPAITEVQVGGVPLTPSNGMVNIPAATASVLGAVLSSTAENSVVVATNGTMSVNSLNVNKLVQTADESLILNGGSASI